jgi:hypothetical protein
MLNTVRVRRRCRGCGQRVVVRLEVGQLARVWCPACLAARVEAVQAARRRPARQGQTGRRG